MNVTQKRVDLVLSRLSATAENDEDDAEAIASALDGMLDDLLGNDFFGTEGQCDPRGDFRNGEWSMTHVEGVDG